jgi:hypothetical protein
LYDDDHVATFVEAVQPAYGDSDACALPWSTLDYDLDE